MEKELVTSAIGHNDDVRFERTGKVAFDPSKSLPRPEYPRPDFVRSETSWLNLNGLWEFEFDDAEVGHREEWQDRPHLNQSILVPFAYQSELSGIADPGLHDHIWYARQFNLPDDWKDSQKHFLLHFGAVDYYCKVWVNNRLMGEHRGGHVPFSFDISGALLQDELNRVVVYVEDTQSKFQPRGKQYWKPQSELCFYTRTSGIWQTVWLEAVSTVHLNTLQIQSDIDKEELTLAIEATGNHLDEEIYWLHIQVNFENETAWQGDIGLVHDNNYPSLKFKSIIPLPGAKLWTPETPHLYDLQLTLYQGNQEIDRVDSYFGMRKVSVENGQVLLNNKPYYLRMVLDQGYFPGGWLTASSDAALRRDVELAKAFGFNGARKHQKIEDPRWLYWADRLGLLVWGEMPSLYEWSQEAERPFVEEWLQMLARDFNHPCIIAWVPFNESWGVSQISREVRQQEFVRKVTALTRDIDTMRLVIDNDGWEHQEGESDLLTIHDYTAEGWDLVDRYSRFRRDKLASSLPQVAERPIMVDNGKYQGEPVMFTEFGGISLIASDKLKEAATEGDWGYSNAASSEQLLQQYQGLIAAIADLGFSCGFCYTQLTDVEQEVNGLLTFDRRPKVDPQALARINQLLG
ncbi:MAG TPA: glycoside hydrolase family 2 TIM barrel-domain containing protein [Chloroflexia bacterium]|nr:glycoside hydrolase family 2 TIM barrel-domain containing protein [Chloroflexia bacterium]